MYTYLLDKKSFRSSYLLLPQQNNKLFSFSRWALTKCHGGNHPSKSWVVPSVEKMK